MTQLIRSRILRTNAVLLFMFGVFGITEDLSSYLDGTFVLKGALLHNPLAVGFVEAHGLALIMAVLFFVNANINDTEQWHITAVTLHLFLGICNLFFWQGFINLNIVRMGAVATIFQFVFVIAHGVALYSLRQEMVQN
jgi:hypothetical protein